MHSTLVYSVEKTVDLKTEHVHFARSLMKSISVAAFLCPFFGRRANSIHFSPRVKFSEIRFSNRYSKSQLTIFGFIFPCNCSERTSLKGTHTHHSVFPLRLFRFILLNCIQLKWIHLARSWEMWMASSDERCK